MEYAKRCKNWTVQVYTDKKENQIFLIYKVVQYGAVATSYMRKGFLIYEEMRKYFTIYEAAVSHVWLCNCSIPKFLIYEDKFDFLFYQCTTVYLYVAISMTVSPSVISSCFFLGSTFFLNISSNVDTGRRAILWFKNSEEGRYFSLSFCLKLISCTNIPWLSDPDLLSRFGFFYQICIFKNLIFL